MAPRPDSPFACQETRRPELRRAFLLLMSSLVPCRTPAQGGRDHFSDSSLRRARGLNKKQSLTLRHEARERRIISQCETFH